MLIPLIFAALFLILGADLIRGLIRYGRIEFPKKNPELFKAKMAIGGFSGFVCLIILLSHFVDKGGNNKPESKHNNFAKVHKMAREVLQTPRYEIIVNNCHILDHIHINTDNGIVDDTAHANWKYLVVNLTFSNKDKVASQVNPGHLKTINNKDIDLSKLGYILPNSLNNYTISSHSSKTMDLVFLLPKETRGNIYWQLENGPIICLGRVDDEMEIHDVLIKEAWEQQQEHELESEPRESEFHIK